MVVVELHDKETLPEGHEARLRPPFATVLQHSIFLTKNGNINSTSFFYCPIFQKNHENEIPSLGVAGIKFSL